MGPMNAWVRKQNVTASVTSYPARPGLACHRAIRTYARRTPKTVLVNAPASAAVRYAAWRRKPKTKIVQ
ncbi:hypothetical protein Skr01_40040 [Sphaerisporangium krabiense]|nr:hypothetical protein Skr01_40040 [Sphaerisporangium krabiense]